ncbi:MAG: hypothetical protein DVB25_06860 [Verrucomicrobia bacterium]|nr:MAG: hypothetical protein DVB25_06860 [Verrucomicrobiota bacterium]
MQNYCKTIGAFAAVSALVAGNVKAEVESELHAGYSNEYLFRGIKLGSQLVEVGGNVKGQAGGLDLSAGFWHGAFDGSANVKQDITSGAASEYDLFAGASKDLGLLSASLGYIYRHYDLGTSWWQMNSHSEDSQELAVGVARDFGFVAASLTYYASLNNTGNGQGNYFQAYNPGTQPLQPANIGNNNKGYTELAVSHSWVLNPSLTLNVGSNVGYMLEKGQATAWTSKVSLDWAIVKHAKLSPFVEFALPLSDDQDTYYLHSNNQFACGSMLSVSF